MSAAGVKITTIRIFISYAHEDEHHRLQIENQIRTLPNFHMISHWHDRKIVPGADWNDQITEELNRANIILLLISSDFLGSSYVRSTEIPMALKRYEFDAVEVVPIVLRPVTAWGDERLKKLQALPKDRVPVVDWKSPDHAYSDIARGIGELIDKITDRILTTTPAGTSEESSEGTTLSDWKTVAERDGRPGAIQPPDGGRARIRPGIAALLVAAVYVVGLASGLGIGLSAIPPLWTFRPSNAVEYNLRGEVRLRALDDIDGALADFQEAVRREPKSPRFLHNLGLAHLVRGEYGLAASIFQEAIIRNRTFLEAYNDLCVAYACQKKYAESAKILDQAKDIVADHPWTLKNQGFILYMQGDYDAAIQKYTDAIHKDPNYFEAYLYRGWAHAWLDHRFEADGDSYHATSGDRSLSRRIDPKAR